MQFDPQEVLGTITDLGTTYGLRIIGALVLLLLGSSVIRVVLSILRRTLTFRKIDETLVGFATSIARVLLKIALYMAALNMLGVQTTSFVAILGAAGLAVGIALKGTLSNFASGVMLILFHPFKVGDFVEAGGVMGTVNEIGIFSTTLTTSDNRVIIVPNSSITDGNITNNSARETRRVDMVFGIGYGDDLRKAKSLLLDYFMGDERVLKDPDPFVNVGELADSSVNFTVRVWVKSADYWPVFFDAQEKVKLLLDDNGISIPFPQQDVHLIKE